jgi:hypothetical protein
MEVVSMENPKLIFCFVYIEQKMWFILEILIQNLQYTKNLPAVLA